MLGRRLIEISAALMRLPSDDPEEIMGRTDSIKLRSSMTLFAAVSGHPVFQAVLDKFFHGEKDALTLRRLAGK